MFEFRFPDVGEGITEGQLVSWKVKEGDTVTADQPLCEVETAKAVVEIPSPRAGTIAKLHAAVGSTIEVGSVLVTIDDGSGGISASVSGAVSKEKEEKQAVEAMTSESSAATAVSEQPQAHVHSVQASAKKLAQTASIKEDAGTVMGVLPEYEEEAAPEQHFIVKSGERIKSIKELYNRLASLSADDYTHHVSEIKNDFATWIRDVFKQSALAEQVRSASSREAMLALLQEEVSKRSDETQEVQAATASMGVIKALPGVRKLARDRGINLTTVPATGGFGAVTRADVLKALGDGIDQKRSSSSSPSSAPAKLTSAENSQNHSGIVVKQKEFNLYGFMETLPFSPIRKTIAHHMQQSLQRTAPATLFDDADATALVRLKHSYSAQGEKISYLPFIIKAVLATLAEFPLFNAHSSNDAVVVKKYYNIGVAVDTEHGLMVPVVKIANKKNVREIGTEIGRLAAACRDRTIDTLDLQAGTFTISNAGSIGGKYATAVINYPETAILYLGRLYESAAVDDGVIRARHTLPLSLTFDHCIIDGGDAARFLNRLKEHLLHLDLLL